MEPLTAKNGQQRTLRNLKTAGRLRSRSKPPIEGQAYLDLYVLQRDRARWERLRQQASQMIECIDRAVGNLSLPEFSGAPAVSPGPVRPVAGMEFKVCPRPKRAARQERNRA